MVVYQLVLSNGEVSQESLSLRFNAVTNVVKDDMLRYFTNIDYDSHFAFAALIKEGSTWKGVATARIIQDKDDSSVAEWAAIVLDAYHGMGIGSCLLYCLSCVLSLLLSHPDGLPLRYPASLRGGSPRKLPRSALDEEGQRLPRVLPRLVASPTDRLMRVVASGCSKRR